MDLDLPQLANFLARLKAAATEEAGDFRSQQPGRFAFAFGGVAQDFTHFLFEASPVALGSPTQFVFHFVLKLANNELCHVSYDIMIACTGSRKGGLKQIHGDAGLPTGPVRAKKEGEINSPLQRL